MNISELCNVCGQPIVFESGATVSNCRHQIIMPDVEDKPEEMGVFTIQTWDAAEQCWVGVTGKPCPLCQPRMEKIHGLLKEVAALEAQVAQLREALAGICAFDPTPDSDYEYCEALTIGKAALAATEKP